MVNNHFNFNNNESYCRLPGLLKNIMLLTPM